MFISTKYKTIVIALSLSMFISCGTQKILINVSRPAEINLNQYKKIAIGSIDSESGYGSQHSNDVADDFAEALFNTKRFDVLDRHHMGKILAEHQLGQTGLVDASTAKQLGKFIGSAALVFGRIQADTYKEQLSKKDWIETKTVGKKNNKRTVKVPHTSYYRKGTYGIVVNVKIVDIETSKMLAVKTLAAKYQRTTDNVDAAAPYIDKSSLYTSCLNDVKNQFSHLVAPYKVQVTAEFQTDDKLPEVKRALTQFKIGEWNEGVKILEKATERKGLKKEVQAKALYNLGMAKMYGGDITEALKLFKNAMNLMPDEDRYQSAILKAKEEKKKADKLKEQA